MPELYIYPVELGKSHTLARLVQISTKSVHNHVEKHPLDMAEARTDAAFNNLPIVRAACEARKIKGLRCQVAHDSNIFARCIAEKFVHNHDPQETLRAPKKNFRARDAARRRIVEDSTLVRRDDATRPWRFC
jgi:hypothetical protein